MNTTENIKNNTPIFDLHCDLLSYLEDTKNTFNDPVARCSFPQLKAGGVKMQTLAIYTRTAKGSHQRAKLQVERYKKLPKTIETRVAIENASGLLEEDEDIDLLGQRLEEFQKEAGPLLYLSLTWNDENRFGGGNLSNTGLKEDGKVLLNLLAKEKIAVDFSHTSDSLARAILEYIDQQNLKIKVLASHSNFREVTDVPRNLPDDVALELIRRGGIIGLNVIKKFIGDPFEKKYGEMVEHGLKLGALDYLSLGADFFYLGTLPDLGEGEIFDKKYGDASCYPHLLDLIRKIVGEKNIEKISYKNCETFLKRVE